MEHLPVEGTTKATWEVGCGTFTQYNITRDFLASVQGAKAPKTRPEKKNVKIEKSSIWISGASQHKAL
jgi:hypothetical protein